MAAVRLARTWWRRPWHPPRAITGDTGRRAARSASRPQEPDGPSLARMNRLADETSPYLRQHADNPVDWYPWGDEAFDRGPRRGPPGPALGRLLGLPLVPRDGPRVLRGPEPPPRCMNAALRQRQGRPRGATRRRRRLHGGRPGHHRQRRLADDRVPARPTAGPFFGGTYFPRGPLRGACSARSLGPWTSSGAAGARGDAADQLAEAVRAGTAVPGRALGRAPAPSRRRPGPSLPAAGRQPAGRASTPSGAGSAGRRSSPSRPWSSCCSWPRSRDRRRPTLDAMATTTLDAMAAGGIYDHLGGGFARYSTDRHWLVPHFEKMLYDKALLARASTCTPGRSPATARYRQVVEETVAYVLRPPMRLAGGGLYSAEDADCEGVEGRFYVWDAGRGAEAVGAAGRGRAGTGSPRRATARAATSCAGRSARRCARPPRWRRPGGRSSTRRDAAGPARPRRQGAHRVERHGGRRPGRGGRRPRPTGLGRRRPRRSATSCWPTCARRRRRAGGCARWQGGPGRARHLAYAADYAWLVEAFTRLAEVTGQARWIGRGPRPRPTPCSSCSGTTTSGAVPHHRARRRAADRPAHRQPRRRRALGQLGRPPPPCCGWRRSRGVARYRRRAERDASPPWAPALAAAPVAFTGLVAAADLAAGGRDRGGGDRRPARPASRWCRRRYLPGAVLAWGEPYPSPLWEGRTDAGGGGSGLRLPRLRLPGADVRCPATLASQLDELTPLASPVTAGIHRLGSVRLATMNTRVR